MTQPTMGDPNDTLHRRIRAAAAKDFEA